MGQRWWEEQEYQLESGRWVPHVHLYERLPRGLEVLRLLGLKDRTFLTRADAKTYSTAIAIKWLNVKGH